MVINAFAFSAWDMGQQVACPSFSIACSSFMNFASNSSTSGESRSASIILLS